MLRNRLEIAPEKSEALILKGSRDRSGIDFHICGRTIEIKRTIKYLGITIDDRNSFGPHVKGVVVKAEEKAARLTRILPNIGGPGDKKRETLYNVLQSVLLYGAPVWYRAMNVCLYKTKMEGAQRRMLLRVASGYRTVSARAIQVVTGTPPIHLLVRERRELFESGDGQNKETKQAARARTLNQWQREWEENREVGQWTKTLIPRIEPWVACAHRSLDYFITQALTGHGSFRSYTYRIRKATDDRCLYCQQIDSPEHTIFRCDRWGRMRMETQLEVGVELGVHNLVPEMLKSRHKWKKIGNMIRSIMKEKEKEEREEQERNRNNPELLIV